MNKKIQRVPNTKCSVCSKGIYRSPIKIRRSKGFYCSERCREIYLNTKYPERIQRCNCCGKKYITNPAYVKRHPERRRYCSTNCYLKIRRIIKVSKKTSHGYKYMLGGLGLIPEHRHIMEKHIGRKLRRHEVVHHINRVKTDNRIENLKVMTNSEHLKLHAREDNRKKDGVETKCIYCGKYKYLSKKYIEYKYKGNKNKCKYYRCVTCLKKYGQMRKTHKKQII